MYSHEQIKLAATLFCFLLVNKSPKVDIISLHEEAVLPYSDAPEDKRTLDTADRLHALAKSAHINTAFGMVKDTTFHELINEITLILTEMTGVNDKSGSPQYSGKYIELMSSTQAWSDVIRTAFDRLDISYGYGEWPQVNVCLYSDGELHVYNRDTGQIKSIGYDGKPQAFGGENVTTSQRALKKDDVETHYMRPTKDIIFRKLSPEETYTTRDPRGFVKSETHNVGKQSNAVAEGHAGYGANADDIDTSCYVVLYPDDYDGEIDPETIDLEDPRILSIDNGFNGNIIHPFAPTLDTADNYVISAIREAERNGQTSGSVPAMSKAEVIHVLKHDVDVGYERARRSHKQGDVVKPAEYDTRRDFISFDTADANDIIDRIDAGDIVPCREDGTEIENWAGFVLSNDQDDGQHHNPAPK